MDEPQDKPLFSPKEYKEHIATAKKRFSAAMDIEGPLREAARRDREFNIGDSENEYQWDSGILAARKTAKKPSLTINKTKTHNELIISAARQNPPAARILPADGGSDPKSAEWMGGLIRNIEAQCDATGAYLAGYDTAVVGGQGFWLVDYVPESPSSFSYRPRICRLPDPDMGLLDHTRKEPNGADSKWAFVFEDIPIEEWKVRHPDIDPDGWEKSDDGWCTQDTVRIANYYWRQEVADVAMLMPDGETLWKSEAPEREAEAVQTRKGKRPVWHWWKLAGQHEEPLEQSIWPVDYCPLVEVVGNEDRINGKLHRSGHTRAIKDPARMYNYWSSEATAQVALQNSSPYIGPIEAFANFENLWQNANASSTTYLPYNSFTEDGQQIPAPTRQMPQQMSSGLIDGMKMAAQEFGMASGQNEPQFGARSNETSGVALNARKVQGELTNYKYPDNFASAVTHTTRILVALIPKLYDSKKIIRILGLDGKEGYVQIDPELDKVYQESIDEVTRQVKRLFNPALGRYDVVASSGPSYQTQRQAATDAMGELSRTMPMVGQVAPDLVIAGLDFPGADKIAARLRKALPPGIADDENAIQEPAQQVMTMKAQMMQGQQALQQMQAQMQEMQAQLQQASQMIQEKDAAVREASATSQLKAMELEIKQQELALKNNEQQLKLQIEREKIASAERIAADKLMLEANIEQERMMQAATNTQAQQEMADTESDAAEQAQTAQSNQMMVAALAEIVDKMNEPKRSIIRIAKDETGAYIGEKIEVTAPEGEE